MMEIKEKKDKERRGESEFMRMIWDFLILCGK